MLALEQLRLTAPQATSTTLRFALTSCIEDGGGEGQAARTASGNPGVVLGIGPLCTGGASSCALAAPTVSRTIKAAFVNERMTTSLVNAGER
jgi:hypothetical protein